MLFLIPLPSQPSSSSSESAADNVEPGKGKIDEKGKADIWAFEITALELALGSPPLSGLPLLSGNQILKIKNRFRLADYENIIKDFRNQKYSVAFKDLVASCLDRDPEKRPAAEALLKHPFFHDCRGKDYLVGTVLPHLESVEERFKKRNREERALVLRNKKIRGYERK